MLFKDLLGPWGLPIVIITGVGIILIALLLFVCFLTPGCIGYECFRRSSKRDGRESWLGWRRSSAIVVSFSAAAAAAAAAATAATTAAPPSSHQ